ncbi:MAG TPA: glycosyl hydrolase 53 family protein [Streptosporangiaceae bacterium]|nr:glycosyl hydrolase 53 family protein [Streptosporangiaceae bacterium]
MLPLILATTGATRRRAAAQSDALPVRGADISFTLQEESIGTTYSLGGAVAPIEKILADAGANFVRLRVWVDPPQGYSDLASALDLARRAKLVGLKIFLDLNYSDFWADPRNQWTPRAWSMLDLDALKQTVLDYTWQVLGAFKAQGTPVDMVQIGNEVNNGILWPTGEIYGTGGENWAPFCALLAAGIAGARDSESDGNRLPVVIHIFGDNRDARYFFDHILEEGVLDFDVIGLTYFPFWNGSLSSLQANLADLGNRYGKPLLIVETAYPWGLTGEGWFWYADQLPDASLFPPTPNGQLAYFQALRGLLEQVPDGRGIGFFEWEPGWLPGVPNEPGGGNPFVDLTMFDNQGEALPALNEAFQPPS